MKQASVVGQSLKKSGGMKACMVLAWTIVGCGSDSVDSVDSGSTGGTMQTTTGGGTAGDTTGGTDGNTTGGTDGNTTGGTGGDTTGGTGGDNTGGTAGDTTGGTDGGTDGDTTGGGDEPDSGSALPACGASYAGGCASPVDLTGAGATASFDFSSVFGAPKCIKVKTSQALTLTGVSNFHPIAPQDCGPVNVLPNEETAQVTRTFSTAGTYGIHCTAHGNAAGENMALAIQVVP